MSWETGNQAQRANYSSKINELILSKEGFLDEREAKLLLYKFLRGNSTFAVDLLSGVKLFPFQHMAIKAMLESDYFLGIWCLDQNEYVLSESGFKKIKNIKIGEKVRSRKKLNLVSDKWVNKEEDGLFISTQSGDSFKAKIGHKTLVYDTKGKFEFKNIKDITTEDHIPIKLGTNVWGDNDITKESSIKRSPYLFYLLGYVLGDGYVDENGIHYCSENSEVQDVILNFIKTNSFKSYSRQKSGNLNFYEYSIFNRKLVSFLEGFGWDKSLKSKNKIIPDELLQASGVELCALIGGLFDADGYASYLKSSSKVGLKNTSLEMLRQVKMLLNNIGIESNLRKSGEHNGAPYYDLVISNDYHSLLKFQNEVDFIVRHKKDNLNTIIQRSKKRNYQNSLVPGLGKMLKEQGSFKSITGVRGSWGENFSQNRFKDLVGIDSSTQDLIDEIQQERVVFSKVKEIRECKTISVDITVENEENYIGNGIVHHNSRGMSKCLAYDDLVWTDSGLKKAIDVKVGEKVQSKNDFNVVEGKTVNKKQKTYKVTSKKGYESEGLDYHRVLVLNKNLEEEWRFAKDLKQGDVLIMRKTTSFPDQDDIFEGFRQNKHPNAKILKLEKSHIPDWYYFFGLLIGDGHIFKARNGIQITSEDDETKRFIESFSKKIGLGFSETKAKEGKVKTLNIYSNALVDFLLHCGFNFKLAHEKSIPSKLLKCSKINACNLLRGLFDTDGYCSANKKKKSFQVVVGFTSSSKELIKQVRNLLLQLGITSATKTCFKGGLSSFGKKEYACKKAWSIRITSRKNINTFFQIGFNVSRKQKTLLKVKDYKYKDNEFSEYIPYIGDYLTKKMHKKSICLNQCNGYTKLNFRKNTSRNLAKKIIPYLSEEHSRKITPLIDENLFFDFVDHVEESENITVDLQVKNENCYVSDGFINHNSFTTGIFAFLDAILNQGVQTGIISKSFRQAKMIFKKIEDIANKPEAKMLGQCITRKSKSNDQWTMEIGQSQIHALPLGDGEKLRGFRFHRIIIDEMLLMPERIYNEVIVPFLSVVENPTEREDIYNLETDLISQGKMQESERYRWPNNKLIMLSSASYKFEYLYKLYEKFDNLILGSGHEKDVDSNRVVMQFSYDCAPKQLYDQNLIDQAKASMSQSQFDREFGAIFTDDSSGYFKTSKMAECTIEDGDGQSIQVCGDPDGKYILSFDPSWAESESSDDFAMQVFKINDSSRQGTLVHSYALSGARMKDHIFYFHYILTHFNIVGICGDYNGGVQFISAANESELFKSSKIEIKTIDTELDDVENYQKALQSAKNEYNLTDNRICVLRKPTSRWISRANEHLQACFDKKRIWFASRAVNEDYHEQRSKKIPIEQLKFLRNGDVEKSQGRDAKMIDFIEHQYDMINLTKTECALINIKVSPQGTQTFDLPQSLKRQGGPDKARKDSYSAFVLGAWMIKSYYDMLNVEQIKVQNTFTPMFIT